MRQSFRFNNFPMKQNKFYTYDKMNSVLIFRLTLISLFVIILLTSCIQKKQQLKFRNRDISTVITRMTEIMVHDITNPPLGARFFSYACLAGYEVVSQNDNKFKSMHGILNSYPQIKKPDTIQSVNYQLAALLAMMETAKKMQPSGKLMEIFEEKFIDSCSKAGFNEDMLNNSKSYALAISQQILAYAQSDGYNKISNLPRYTPLKTDGAWYPTPPGFLAPVEPYFNTIRPFTLDSAAQFKPLPPVTYSAKVGSPFYESTSAVYKEGNELKEDHRVIASFWDCNPFKMNINGHVMYASKKISPGGHWMNITRLACQKTSANVVKSLEAYACVAITIADAFISCWDEKYRSLLIRPETYINKYIDGAWMPLLQTPPFPEYTSGHSVLSTAAAVMLTRIFGDNFSFADSTEVEFGLPVRHFTSFIQAAEEAAISRFYGGIHYMPAIVNGSEEGRKLGGFITKKLKTEKTLL